MKKYFVFASLLFLLLASAFLPIFNLKELIVTGNNFVTHEQICSLIDFNIGQNIFLFNSFKAKNNLLANSFISSVGIKYLLPDKISVNIVERSPCCYVKYLNDSYILVDDTSRVLKVCKSCDINLPVITGLNFDSFTVNENFQDDTSITYALQLSKIILKNGVKESNLLVDFSNINDIHLYIRDIDILFGNTDEIEQKVATIKAILDSGADCLNKAGTLSLKENSLAPVFKFIT